VDSVKEWLTPDKCLPRGWQGATLVGRAWSPAAGGPVPVAIVDGILRDLSPIVSTSAELLNLPDPLDAVRNGASAPMASTAAELLANCDPDARDTSRPWLLGPCDLQAVKAAGVTFVASLLERVIEEQARGDASKAEGLRRSMVSVIGESLHDVRPGSPESQRLKDLLIAQGIWSQYLEVGIGPDAEVFTKAQPMSAVGTGAEVGIHPRSEWNNPEPEIVLAVNGAGKTVGAALGNDVNLRDFEGRSALLLGKAKDNNASCAIGPLIRLFDEGFGMDDVRQAEVALHVSGPDGFSFDAHSSMSRISRDPLDLVTQTIGANHQYPDGLVLFLGTMFAPTIDRSGAGQGFTHVVGDVVTVSTPSLGALVNRVNHSDKIDPWTFGTLALIKHLVERQQMRRGV
jgi:fumarylacetoacetate (FAA) hydrolase family protein